MIGWDLSMDPLGMMIILSIGNVVGWLTAMYVKNALPGLIGHIVISTIGVLLLFFVRFKKWN
jgi:uncharacterized membrane protein YeaQ/YmgE (transglycosylase-associated protein family)